MVGRPVTTASRFDSTPAISFSIATSNSFTPSRSSLSVTSSRSMPASRSSESACSTASLPTSAVGPVISARSAAASSVGIGIVFTVSGATRPSTYIVSRYFGFFTPVEAHSGRCTGAPALNSSVKRGPRKISLKRTYAAWAFTIPALPWRSVRPSCSSRLSTSESTRETKKLATECTSSDSPASLRRSSPRMNAPATFS